MTPALYDFTPLFNSINKSLVFHAFVMLFLKLFWQPHWGAEVEGAVCGKQACVDGQTRCACAPLSGWGLRWLLQNDQLFNSYAQ